MGMQNNLANPAATECAFSILSNSFTEKQTHSLQDYIETCYIAIYSSEQCYGDSLFDVIR